MNTKSSKKILPATVFAAIIVLSAFAVMCTTVSASGPQIVKGVSESEVYLGDIITVTLDVEVPAGPNMTVEDPLPGFLEYISGTFEVDGVSVTPTVDHGVISTTELDAGTHTITFNVTVDSVEATNITDENCAYLKNSTGIIVDQNCTDITTHPYEGFVKGACIPVGGDNFIDLEEDFHWGFGVLVANTFTDCNMTDVVVKDNFGAEIEIDDNVSIPSDDWSKLNIRETGKTNKIHLKWSIDDLEPGEEAELFLNISTDNNTAKRPKQEYTEAGDYDLNSGATLKFKLDCPPVEGIQLSANTGSINFTVPGPFTCIFTPA